MRLFLLWLLVWLGPTVFVGGGGGGRVAGGGGAVGGAVSSWVGLGKLMLDCLLHKRTPERICTWRYAPGGTGGMHLDAQEDCTWRYAPGGTGGMHLDAQEDCTWRYANIHEKPQN
jgi:hypothetical protein